MSYSFSDGHIEDAETLFDQSLRKSLWKVI
jgi:hypothetical protein